MVKLVSKNVAVAAVLLIVVAAVFLGVDAVLKTVDVAAVPEPFKAFAASLLLIFGLPVTVFVFALVRNFYGYYRVQVQAELDSKPEVKYSFDKFGVTVGLYVTVGIGVFAALPAPWNSVAVVGVFILDIVRSEVAYLFRK